MRGLDGEHNVAMKRKALQEEFSASVETIVTGNLPYHWLPPTVELRRVLYFWS